MALDRFNPHPQRSSDSGIIHRITMYCDFVGTGSRPPSSSHPFRRSGGTMTTATSAHTARPTKREEIAEGTMAFPLCRVCRFPVPSRPGDRCDVAQPAGDRWRGKCACTFPRKCAVRPRSDNAFFHFCHVATTREVSNCDLSYHRCHLYHQVVESTTTPRLVAARDADQFEGAFGRPGIPLGWTSSSPSRTGKRWAGIANPSVSGVSAVLEQ